MTDERKPPLEAGAETQSKTTLRTESAGFGTFKGVFIPSILTICGVIMYLRMGWIVGNVGIVATIVIVTMASAITLLTGLSISATATNMKVGAGGAYFMISRSFGIEAGAAIGLPLFLAQCLGISFYIAGFAESVHSLLPNVPVLVIGVVSLISLTTVAYLSANLALKAQLGIFFLITLSLVSFFMGVAPEGELVVPETLTTPVAFWAAFAVFFPAVTGIEAGLSMSGDLKNPSRSLPIGTLSAVLVGYLVYLAIPVFLWKLVPSDVLRTNPLIMTDVARFGSLILLGIWGATLSSALGALLGAPRTLQALARDRIVPGFLGTGTGPADEPRIATAAAFFISLAGLLLGDLNAIAPILSMFFLTSYGILNLSAGLEGLMGNPSWRPTFRPPWPLSLIGAAACFSAMLMIDAGATYGALFFCALVYWIMLKRRMRTRWGDVRRGILLSLARFAIYRLDRYAKSARSWRPHILVLSGSPSSRWYLVQLAHAISHKRSFLTVASILPTKSMTPQRIEGIETSTRDFLQKQGIPALVDVHLADSPMSGVKALIENYGMGPLVPNTILLGETERQENFVSFSEVIQLVHSLRRNLVIVREAKEAAPKTRPRKPWWSWPGRTQPKRIDLWWEGHTQNSSFMLGLAYLLQSSTEWKGSNLVLKSLARSDEQRDGIIKHLRQFIVEGRLAAELDVQIVGPDDDEFATIRRHSAGADLVFLGMRAPKEGETAVEYSQQYKDLLDQSESWPTTIFALAGENLEFEKIFS